MLWCVRTLQPAFVSHDHALGCLSLVPAFAGMTMVGRCVRALSAKSKLSSRPEKLRVRNFGEPGPMVHNFDSRVCGPLGPGSRKWARPG